MKKNLLFKVFLLCTCLMTFAESVRAQVVAEEVSTGPLQKVKANVLERISVPCSDYTMVIISSLDPVAQGVATVLPHGYIEFTPGLGCRNTTVEIRYRVSCTVWTSEGTLLVKVSEYNPPVNEIPDHTVCVSDMPEGVSFVPALKYIAGNSTNLLDGFAMPLVGDLNNDGKPEIVSLALRSGTLWSGHDLGGEVDYLKIFNGQTGEEIGSWPMTRFRLRYEPRQGSISKLAMADLDRDGIAEIILTDGEHGYIYCFKPVYDSSGKPSTFRTVWKHDTSSESFKQPITSTEATNFGAPVPYIADINGDGKPEVIVYNKIYDGITGRLVCTLETLNRYSYTTSSSTNATIHNTYAFVGRRPSVLFNDDCIPCMSIVDINGDGILDIVAGSKVYIMKDNNGVPALDRIIHGPTSVTAHRGGGNNTFTCQVNDGFTAVADIDGNGTLDVVVFAPSKTGMYETSDWVMYVWEPMSSAPATPKAVTYMYTRSSTGTFSYPFIGDINGRKDDWSGTKKLPEICVNAGRAYLNGGWLNPSQNGPYAGSKIAVHPLSNINPSDASFNADQTTAIRGHVLALTYHANPDGSTPIHQRLKLSWAMEHQDESSCTGITMFDFDNDGTMELCYRDELTLRIISPSGKTPQGQPMDLVKNSQDNSTIPGIIRLKQKGVRSYTGHEGPVIADVNLDGSADIVTMANDATLNTSNTSWSTRSGGYIYVFEHASGSDAWAPCPPVWNQGIYFPTQINENLTVPPKPLPILTTYTKNGEQIQPFNGHWIQQPIVQTGKEYKPMVRHADAVIKSMTVKVNASSTLVTLVLYNKGTATLSASTPISFYNGGTTGKPVETSNFIMRDYTGVDLFPHETTTRTYTLSGNYNDCLIWARVMADNAQFPVRGFSDCDYSNNTMEGIDCPYLDVKTTVYPNTFICGDNGVVRLSVTAMDGGKFAYKGTPTFQWYKDDVEFAGQTDSVLIADQAGIYSCKVIDGICRKRTQEITVTVDHTKEIAHLTLSATPATGYLCTPAGQVVITVGNPESYTSDPIRHTWYKDNVFQTSPTGNTYTATTAGNYRLLLTSGLCMTANSFDVVQTTNTTPTVGSLSAVSATCVGTAPVLSAPQVTENGCAITSQGWQISTTAGGNTFVSFDPSTNLVMADNGKIIRYYAINDCGTSYSNTVALTVATKATIAGITAPAAICSGSSLSVSNPLITNTGGLAVSSSSWQIETAVGSGEYSDIAIPYTVSYSDNGKKIRFRATNGCGNEFSNEVAVTVNQIPVPTLSGLESAVTGQSGVTYTTQPGMSNYVWSITGGTITSGGGNTNEATVTWTAASSGTISVSYTSPQGCPTASPAVKNVTLGGQNPASITGTLSVCPLTTYEYTTESGKFDYEWTVVGGTPKTALTGSNKLSVLWDGSATPSVKVSYRHQNNPGLPKVEITESSITKQKVTAITTPPVGATVCYGESHTMTVVADCEGGTATYQWKKDGSVIGGNSASYQASATGSYEVSVTGVCGSAVSSPVTVTVKSQQVATLSADATAAVTTQKVVFTTGNNGSNYIWTYPGATHDSGGTSTDNTLTVSWLTEGQKTVKVSYTVDGCPTTEASKTVTVTTQGTPGTNFGVDLAANGVCQNTTAEYETDSPGYNYQWTVTGGTINGSSTSRKVNVTWTTVGTGTIKVAYSEAPSSSVVSSDLIPFPIHSVASSISGLATAVTTQQVTYTAGTGTNYVWTIPGSGSDATIVSGGLSGNNTVVVSWATEGDKEVKVKYTTTNGCQSEESIQAVKVTEQKKPGTNFLASLSANGICQNTTASYTTDSPGYNYQWTVVGGRIEAGENERTVMITWNVDGTGSIRVAYSEHPMATAVSSDVVTFPIWPATATISGQLSAVTTQQVIYTAGEGTDYTWSLEGANSTIVSGGGTNDNTIKLSWSSAGDKVVKVKYKTPKGCWTETSIAIVQVIEQGRPTTNFGTTLSQDGVCVNTTTSYETDDPGYNYLWTVTGGTIIGSPNNRTVNVKWETAGQGTIKVEYGETSSSTPVSSNTVPFTIHSDVATISGAGTAVTTQQVTYTAGTTGCSNFVWTVPGGSDVTIVSGGSNTDNTITVSWASAGVKEVKVKYTTSNGCQTTEKTQSVSVSAQGQPGTGFANTLAANGVCKNTTASYETDTEGYNYLWTVTGGTITNGATARTVTVKWETVGQGSIKVAYSETAQSSPVSSNTVNFPIHSLDATLEGLTAAVTTQQVTYTAGTAGCTNYVWTIPGDATIVSGGGSSDNTVVVSWASAGSKTIKVKYTTPAPAGCQSDEVTKNVTVTAQSTPGTNFGTTLAANGVCNNTTVDYTTDTEGYNYKWEITGGTINSGENERTVNVTWNTVGQGTIKVSYGQSAQSTPVTSGTVTFNIHSLDASLTGPATAVTTQQVTYTAGAGGSNYVWTTGDATIVSGGTSSSNTVTVSWATSGNKDIKVKYTTSNGCQTTEKTQSVSVNAQGQPGTNFGNTLAASGVCLNTTADYETDTPGYNYKWEISGGTIISGELERTVKVKWTTVGQGTIKVSYGESAQSTPVASNLVTFDIHSLDAEITGLANAVTTQQVTYTAGAGSDYSWTIQNVGSDATIVSGGSPNGNVTVSWATAGTKQIKVQYKTPEGCLSELVSRDIAVTTQGKPGTGFASVLAGGVCKNTTADYQTDTEGYNYKWTITGGTINSGERSRTVNITWDGTGQGSIKVEYGAAATSEVVVSDVVTFDIHPIAATISGSSSAVTTQQVTYTTGAGGTNYVWTIPDSGTDATIVSGGTSSSNTVTVSWATSGSKEIKVKYTTNKGCQSEEATKAISVSSQGKPGTDFGVTLAANGVCKNTTASYTTDDPGYNYQWTVTGGTINGSSTDRTVNVTWNTVGTGTIKVAYSESAQSESVSSDVVSFDIHSLAATLDGSTSALATQQVTYTAGTGTNYVWTIAGSGADATIVGGGTSSSSTVTVSWANAGSKTVKVKYTTPKGCQSEEVTKTVSVSSQGQPGTNFGVTLAANGVCKNTTASYTTDDPGYNYQWTISGGTINSGENERTVNITWNTAGQGTIKVAYSENSQAQAVESNTVTFDIHPLTSSVSGAATAVTTQQVTYTAGTGTNYVWNIPNATIISGGTGTDNTVKVSWATEGSKEVKVKYTTNKGCQSEESVQTVVLRNQSKPRTDFLASLHADGICQNTTATYTIDDPGYNYKWTVIGGRIESGEHERTATITWNVAGQGSIQVACSEEPTATAVSSDVVTFDIYPATATISGLAATVTTQQATYTAGTGTSYVWTLEGANSTTVSGGGSGDNTITVSWASAGDKSVKVKYITPNGCLTENAIQAVRVTEQERPGTGFGNTLAANGVCVNTTASYTTDTDGFNYLWTVTGGTITSGADAKTVNVKWETAGTGTIKVAYGQSASSTPLESNLVTFTIHSDVATISGSGTAVTTQSVTYTAGTGTNYVWTVPGAGADATIVSGGSSTDNTITVSWASSGVKEVKVSYITPNGCQTTVKTQSVSVSAQGQPGTGFANTLAANGVCKNTTESYETDTEGYNYKWTVTGGTIIGSSTNRTVTVKWETVGQGSIKVEYGETISSTPVASNTVNFPIHSLDATLNGLTAAVTTQKITYTAGTAGCTNYVWTIPGDATIVSGGGSSDNTVVVSWASAGSKTIKVKYTTPTPAGCQSDEVTKNVTITAQSTPGTNFGTTLAANGVCKNTTASYTTDTDGFNFLWEVTGGTINSGKNERTVNVTWNTVGQGTIKVSYGQSALSTPVTSNTVTFNIHSLDASLTGPATAVTTQQVTYTAAAGGSNYVWTIPGAGADATIVSGGTSSSSTVGVSWASSGAKSISVSYVTGNGCQTTVETKTVNVNAQGQPGTNFGNTLAANGVCLNTTESYTADDENRYNYLWEVTGGTITSGATTKTVTVKWTTVGQGTIKVSYSESAQSTPVASNTVTFAIHSLDAAITGLADAVTTQRVTYTAGAGNTYAWTIPASDATIVSGGSPNDNVTVWWATAGTKQVKVQYKTPEGCLSEVVSRDIIVTAQGTPGSHFGDDLAANGVCKNTTASYQTDTEGFNYTWTITGGTINYGERSRTVNITWNGTGQGTIKVSYGAAATSEVVESNTVTFDIHPIAATIDGLTSALTTQQVTYTAGTGSNYTWTIPDADATIVSGGTSSDNTVKISWANAGSKTVKVKYTTPKGCQSEEETKTVTVTSQGQPGTDFGVSLLAEGICFNTQETYTTETGKHNYKWTVTGGTIHSGEHSHTATVNWGSAGTGTIKVEYSEDPLATAVASDVVTFDIHDKPETPVVSAPSAVCNGTPLNLTTPTVNSTKPILSDKWTLNGAHYTGHNVTHAEHHGHHLVYEATNACGSTSSAPVAISVHTIPTVTVATSALNICPDVAVDLVSMVENPDNHALSFFRDASGGSALAQTVVSHDVPTTYHVEARNTGDCPSATRVPINIGIKTATRITGEPVNPNAILHQHFSLSVAAEGENLQYQWYKDDVSIDALVNPTAATATLTVSSATIADEGQYHAAVTGDCGTTKFSMAVAVSLLSADATLKDLQVNTVSVPDFDPQVVRYVYTVNCNVESVDIIGIPNHPNATVVNRMNCALEPGDNEFLIVVTAENGSDQKTYSINVVRDCYIPQIVQDLEDAIICTGDSHTFEIIAEGVNMTYEWYCGNNLIFGETGNTYTISNSKPSDYEHYYVIIRSVVGNRRASVFSHNARLWVAEELSEHLFFETYPDPALIGRTHYVKVAGYTDVTKYTWSYSNEDVYLTPEEGGAGQNETWVTFGTLSEGTGTLTVTMEHPCGTRELSQEIRVQQPTGGENPMGTDDVTASTVQVYPNPTSGILKVTNTQENQTIRVMDVAGMLKGTYQTQKGTTTIDLTGYAKGTYMVQYNGKSYKVIKK